MGGSDGREYRTYTLRYKSGEETTIQVRRKVISGAVAVLEYAADAEKDITGGTSPIIFATEERKKVIALFWQTDGLDFEAINIEAY